MIPKKGEILELIALKDILIGFDESVIPPIAELIKRYENEAVARKSLKPHTITLTYGNNHKVDRVISIHHNKGTNANTQSTFQEKSIKKDFYPKHLEGKEWVNGLGDRTQWQLYHENLLPKAKGKWVLWHEGEKAVDYALSRGLISTSIVGSLAQDKDYIKSKIEHLISLGISGIIFIADHDLAGFKKVNELVEIALNCGMPCLHFPIETIYPRANKGDDFVEYSQSLPQIPNNMIRVVIERAIATEKERLLAIGAEEKEKINSELIKSFEKTYNRSLNDTAENNQPLLVEQFIKKIADSTINEADKNLEMAKFCSQNKIAFNIVQKAIQARVERNNNQTELDETKGSLEHLINVPNEQLNLNYIFGDYLAETIKQSAQGIPTNPDAVVTIFLPVLSSIIGTRSRIIVNPDTRYIVPFILRTMIVARSGNKKSPTARLALDALHTLNSNAYKSYKRDLQVWQESEGNEPKPILKRYIVQDSSIDGMIKAHEENPQGFLCYVDELFGYFKRMNKFNNGDDIQRDLELYEGKQLIKTRANEESNIFLERTAISITGTIQEVALKQILTNKDDLTGISARWLIWAGKMPLGLLSSRTENNGTSFPDLVDRILDSILAMDIDSDLLIENQAYELFRQWQHGVMRSIANLSLPQLEAKYSKIESDVIKFAGILHYLYKITQPDLITNDLVINSEIMKRAIVLGNYYLRHFCYIVTKCQDDLLSGQLLKILELVQKKGEITASNVRMFIREFKDVPSTKIDELLLSLVELGKVDQIPTKRGVKIKSL